MILYKKELCDQKRPHLQSHKGPQALGIKPNTSILLTVWLSNTYYVYKIDWTTVKREYHFVFYMHQDIFCIGV